MPQHARGVDPPGEPVFTPRDGTQCYASRIVCSPPIPLVRLQLFQFLHALPESPRFSLADLHLASCCRDLSISSSTLIFQQRICILAPPDISVPAPRVFLSSGFSSTPSASSSFLMSLKLWWRFSIHSFKCDRAIHRVLMFF